jgi:HEPN domain-containing protein
MNPLTLEWINKAEGDFRMAQREIRARTAPVYDGVCFHAQQCAEKYLKAVLQEHKQYIPKTHRLAELLTLVLQVDPTCQFLLTDLEILEDYAVDFRYPGLMATQAEAKAAFKAAKNVRLFLRGRLNLE